MLAPFIQEQLDFPYQNFDPEQEFLNDPAGFFMLLNRNVYLQNLMCDHPEYFDTLPEETMQKLDKIRTIGAFLSCYVNAQAATYGINANLAKWLEEPGMVDANIAHLDMMRIQVTEVLK